jgi:hypothetical protein
MKPLPFKKKRFSEGCSPASTSSGFWSLPCRSARAFIITKKTGTKISTFIVEVIMPPTIGAAIGFITSDPTPVSHRIGTRLARTAATVISLGRNRWTAPSASLARLLPVIEINKEFTEFFNDPEREHLNWWQSIVFSALGIVGFVLGAILIAAVSGLTQGS